ncbi:serine-rich adhesin for platelets-like [Watersipora subatra]|uniref:serine-rich adhesin for platelets-like n=1 Tax=Watersipora subatra TaxID=2589382 RepID=UPI00355B8D90
MVYSLMRSSADLKRCATDRLSGSHLADEMTSQAVSSVCKHATLKKMKTNKTKFFVLHKDSTTAPARLEYYDTEQQWKKKKKAKRTIYLRTCFSINPFSDARVRYGVALFTKDDSFQIGFASEQTRDMWLADMRLLSHSPNPGHKTVEHMWDVRVQTRSMKSSFEGNFKLSLNKEQTSLQSKDDPQQIFVFPLDVITHCVIRNRYFALEVNHSAVTGPGEIWLELEDSLIAQHVHRAFQQNRSKIVSTENAFRPVSRSLTFKDKSTAMSTRLRSGSDAKLRSRIGQTLYKYSSMALSASNFTSIKRGRSDSVDSHSTTTSLSTDESDCGHNWQSVSRSVTPDPRTDTQSQYMPMTMTKKSVGDEPCKCLSNNCQMRKTENNLDMSMGCLEQSHDRNYNLMYMDMSGGYQGHADSKQDEKSTCYVDMSFGGRVSPSTKGYKLRPEPVKCYVSDDRVGSVNSNKPESSVKDRTQTGTSQPNDYVEMRRTHKLTGRDKSSSAPHLIPASHQQQQRSESDLFMNLDFDDRGRTSSLSCTHRPRGSSWSQSIRPRAATTEQKRRWPPQRTSGSNTAEDANDYIDMTQGSSTGYVEMSLDKASKQRLELVKQEDCEYQMAVQTSPRVSPLITHPFPELLSASSEDDVSLNSMEGSMSLHSLTSSADNMSTSSHSSHHSTAIVSSLDAEPHASIHTSPTPLNSSSYIRTSTSRLLFRPTQVASYIVDEMDGALKASNCSNYVEMCPAASKNTKQ